MQVRIIGIGGKSRVANVALAVTALGIGTLFMVFGFVLLAALATVGVVVGAGAMLVRALRGGSAPQPEPRELDGWRADLDPRLDVRPGGVEPPALPPSGDA